MAVAWSEERVAIAIKLAKAGKSRSAIAKELGGVTRSAVIGKLNRLGVCEKVGMAERVLHAKRANNAKVLEREKKRAARLMAVAFKPDTRPKRIVPELVVEPHNRRGLADMHDNQCHWPIGDPGTADFHFCDGIKIVGKSYCPHHDRVAYRSFDAEPRSEFRVMPTKAIQMLETMETEPEKEAETV